MDREKKGRRRREKGRKGEGGKKRREREVGKRGRVGKGRKRL